MQTTAIVKLTGSGTAVSVPCRVLSVTLAPAAATATAILLDGGSGGADKLKLCAANVGSSATWVTGGNGILCGTDAYITLSGASAVAYVEYGPP